jgi:cell division septation protein DedD
LKILWTMLIVVAMAIMATGSALGAPGHCPDKDSTSKVEASFDGEFDNTVLAAGTLFCVKAGSAETGGNTGILTADGETTLVEYLKAAGIVGGDGEGRNVSYYIVYGRSTPSPSPSGSPEPTFTPSPSLTPTPSQSPEPTPTEQAPTPSPSPQPSEEPRPSPTSTPDMTPATGTVGEPVTNLPDTAMEK